MPETAAPGGAFWSAHYQSLVASTVLKLLVYHISGQYNNLIYTVCIYIYNSIYQ